MTAQLIAKKLVADYPDDALELASELLKLVSIELVAKARAELAKPVPRLRRIETRTVIVNEVAAYFGLTLDEIGSRRRSANVMTPRIIAMLLQRRRLAMSLTQLGDFWHRDHTSVLSVLRRNADLLESPDLLAIEQRLDEAKR